MTTVASRTDVEGTLGTLIFPRPAKKPALPQRAGSPKSPICLEIRAADPLQWGSAMELHREDLNHQTPHEARERVSSAAVLACWSDYQWQEFVSVNGLSPFDRLIVTTRNHVYEIVVTSPETRAVLVRGGTVFPTFALATIVGGRNRQIVELGTVAVGLHLELEMQDGRWMATTPIETLAVVPAGAIHCSALTS